MPTETFIYVLIALPWWVKKEMLSWQQSSKKLRKDHCLMRQLCVPVFIVTIQLLSRYRSIVIWWFSLFKAELTGVFQFIYSLQIWTGVGRKNEQWMSSKAPCSEYATLCLCGSQMTKAFQSITKSHKNTISFQLCRGQMELKLRKRIQVQNSGSETRIQFCKMLCVLHSMGTQTGTGYGVN